jgi:hypothetical protein
MSIGAGDMMRNTIALKKCIQSLVLTTLIGLNSKNPLVEEALNKILKITKFLKHLRLVLEQINPSKLTKIINKTDIVFITINRLTGRASYIRKY